MVWHSESLDVKIGYGQFGVTQMSVGKDAFVNMLKASLAGEAEEIAAE